MSDVSGLLTMSFWVLKKRSAIIFGEAIRPNKRFSENGHKSPNKFEKLYSSSI